MSVASPYTHAAGRASPTCCMHIHDDDDAFLRLRPTSETAAVRTPISGRSTREYCMWCRVLFVVVVVGETVARRC